MMHELTKLEYIVLKDTVSGIDALSCDSDTEMLLIRMANPPYKYCSHETLANTVYRITPNGRIALSEYERRNDEAVRQQAQNESEKRFERNLKIFSAVTPFVTFIIGLVVEHFGGIVAYISALFKA